MAAYYNEVDRNAAGWLRNLISNGLIPAGDVDERDIRDVCANDLQGYVQCHFFAGLGGWPAALRLAGWPDDRPAWTGSCPCQPFSQGGTGAGFADERHLWPAFHWLIQQCQPDNLFGEQVESPLGRAWIDLVSTDLEGLGYACGPVDTPSAGVGAPNIRQRFFWVADTKGRGFGINGVLSQATGGRQDPGQSALSHEDTAGWMGNASHAGLSHTEPSQLCGTRWGSQGRAIEQPSGAPNPWSELEWLDCTDGRRRPAEPGVFPLAARNPGDVVKLRAIGNAINFEAAAEVIRAYFDVRALAA